MPTPTSIFYVRPGLASYAWSYAGTTLASGSAASAVSRVAFDASSLQGQEASRGDLQYSLDNGKTWTAYALPVDGSGAYVAVAGTLWRFLDKSGGDSVTPDAFNVHYQLADGSVVTEVATVVPDTQPVGLKGANDTVFSTMAAGDVVDLLSAIDSGSQTGGRWAIDSQSQPGLFKVVYDAASDTGARLVVADPARIPEAGTAVSVTIHYYDRYQVDSNGTPIGSGGVTRTLNYSIEDGNTDSLAGLSAESKAGTANGAYGGGPALATLSGGGFVAVWQAPDRVAGDGSGAIWAQLRDASGNALGTAFALTPSGDGMSEGEPAVSALAGGRFVVAYTLRSDSGNQVAYRVVEANGSVGAEHVLDAAGDAGMPAVATLADGAFAVGWRSGGTVHVQQLGADGAAIGAAQAYAALGTAYSPALTALATGGFVVSWGEIGDGNVYAALKGGAAFVASGDGYAASYATAAPLPHVTALAGGGFVVAWDSYINDPRGFSISDVFFQRFDDTGRALGEVVQANVASGGGRYDAAVTALSDGSFLVAWQGDDGDGNGIHGRRFGADGSALDVQEFALNQLRAGDQTSPDVQALAGGGFAAAWIDTAADGSATVEVRVLPGATVPPVHGGTQDGNAGDIVVTPPPAVDPVPTTPTTPTTPTAPTTPTTPTVPTTPTTPVTTTPTTPVETAPTKLVGTSGHDTLAAPAGVAKVDGLDGLDTVVYGGARSAYTVAHSGSDLVVSNAAGLNTTLSNVERIQFGDGMLALDLDGNGGEAYRLYQAAFDRTPDKVGLGFWINALDKGHSLGEAAEGFLASAEFASLYGAHSSDTQFIQALYQNVLHRTPDAGGYAFWLDAVDNATRADILVAFSESAENVAQVVGSIQDGIAFTPWI